MDTSEKKRKVTVPPHVDESALKTDDEKCGDKTECEEKEIQELQADDPGNQGG